MFFIVSLFEQLAIRKNSNIIFKEFTYQIYSNYLKNINFVKLFINMKYFKLVAVLISFFYFSCSDQSKSTNEESKKACEVNCEKSCRLGCYATAGNKNCIYLDDGSMPCCDAKVNNLSKEEFISIVVEKSYSSCKK